MMLTVPGPASLAEYMKKRDEVVVPRPSRCPECHGRRMWKHTGYERKARDADGRIESVWIQRYRCFYCRLLVSCLFEFLVPYVQYTVQALAAWVAAYVESPMTYEQLAWSGEGDEKSTVFRKVHTFSRKSEELIAEVQTEAMLNRAENVDMEWQQEECPNSWKAHTSGKAAALNAGCSLLLFCRRLMRRPADFSGAEVLEQLHKYFITSAEGLRSIFSSGNRLRLSNQQSMHRVIF